MKLIHHSPLGALEIPTVLGAVEPGAEFDVDLDIAVNLLDQDALYAVPGGWDALTVDDLKAVATHRGIPAGGKKNDLIAAIVAGPIMEEADQ